jgi:hypothetical protein
LLFFLRPTSIIFLSFIIHLLTSINNSLPCYPWSNLSVFFLLFRILDIPDKSTKSILISIDIELSLYFEILAQIKV